MGQRKGTSSKEEMVARAADDGERTGTVCYRVETFARASVTRCDNSWYNTGGRLAFVIIALPARPPPTEIEDRIQPLADLRAPSDTRDKITRDFVVTRHGDFYGLG